MLVHFTQLALCIEGILFFSHSGRCKSAFHRFLENLMEKVEDRLRTQEKKRRQMILPHCTWENFEKFWQTTVVEYTAFLTS